MARSTTSRERLAEAIKRSGGVTEASRTLGVSRNLLYLLIRGERRPGLELAVKIAAQYGIAAADWIVAA